MESLNEALIELVKALGGSKQVGPRLWPDAAPDAAQRKLLDCLNDDRPHHLTPSQLMLLLRLGRERGLHQCVEFMLHDLGYAAPVPVEPLDELAELQRQFLEATRQMQAVAHRMEHLNRAVPVVNQPMARANLRAAA